LSADERRRRRVCRNVIMWFLGATILIITAMVLGNL
jgi:predicted nucleic acid-binding Zn ribbon protein